MSVDRPSVSSRSSVRFGMLTRAISVSRLPGSRFWLLGAAVLFVSAAGIALAGPCYSVGNYGSPTCNNPPGGLIYPAGPCPWGPLLPDQAPPQCGVILYYVAVPIGTSGNMASGFMSQGYTTMTCRYEEPCSLVYRPGPISPPVILESYVPGNAIAVGTATVWNPTGGICPPPPPPPNPNGGS
jgi:hypothetical protein